MFGEDEDWLHDLSIDMFPHDGCLPVYGVGEQRVTAFLRCGTGCLQQIVDETANGTARPVLLTTGDRFLLTAAFSLAGIICERQPTSPSSIFMVPRGGIFTKRSVPRDDRSVY